MATKTTAKKTSSKSTKTTARKTTSKTTATRTSNDTSAPLPAETPCAYPSCSERGTQEVKGVDACGLHAPIFEAQADDGAGIEQIVRNYKRPA